MPADSFFKKCFQIYSLVRQGNPKLRNRARLKLSSDDSGTSLEVRENPGHLRLAESPDAHFNKTSQSQSLLKKRPRLRSQIEPPQSKQPLSQEKVGDCCKLLGEPLMYDRDRLDLLRRYEKAHSDYVRALDDPTQLGKLQENFGSFYDTLDWVNRKLDLGLRVSDTTSRPTQTGRASRPTNPSVQNGFDLQNSQAQKMLPNPAQSNLPHPFQSHPKSQPRAYPNPSWAVRQSVYTKSMTVTDQDKLETDPRAQSIPKTVSTPVDVSKYASLKQSNPPNRTLAEEADSRVFSVDSSKWVFSADSPDNHGVFDLDWVTTGLPDRQEQGRNALERVVHLVWFERHVPMYLVRRLDADQR